jgi:hypothetical protein
LEESQKKQLQDNVKKARRDLKESIWRSYNHLALLAKDNSLKTVELGLVHSSAAESPISNILNRLSTDGDVEKGVGPQFLVRNWSPAFKEWSTKSVKDAFYASPVYPRILNSESIKETIARGVESGLMAYVGKSAIGKYQPFAFKQSLRSDEIDFSEHMYIIQAEVAEEYLKKDQQSEPPQAPVDDSIGTSGGEVPPFPTPAPAPTPVKIAGLQWAGAVPPQKWMNFYTKVLSRFAGGAGLKLTVQVDVSPTDGISRNALEETRNALRELGLDEKITEL